MIDAENIEINNESQAEPFVKWLGRKRQLLDRILPRMPKEYSTYHEPFLGGGAVFFSEKPVRAYLNDVNKELICCYEIIKKEPEKLINRLADIDNEYKQLKKRRKLALSNTTFVSYSDSGFSVEQHIKLANEFKRLDRLGAKLMLTNHDTDLIRELYKDYDISVADVRRSVNGDGANRTGTEVIITNEYERRG